MKTADRARGKWRGVMLTLGVDERFLSGKHGPCPFCEGRDRFRWDNREGKGTFICSQCGAGDGIEMLKRLKGWDFKTVAQEVDKIVGGCSVEPIRKPADDADRNRRMNELWTGAIQVDGNDPASVYLAGRGVAHMATCLRYHANCVKPFGGGYGPAMLALVHRADDSALTLHRTFLDHPEPGEKRLRALMSGELTDGCAIRLFPAARVMGIAEGIETAIAASKRFGMPVWAALNSTMLAKWIAPAGVEEVVVFGDSDPAFGGQAAAYALAHRLATRNRLKVDVRLPVKLGRDWADSDAA